MLNVKRKRRTQATLDKHIKRLRVSEMDDSGNSSMTELFHDGGREVSCNWKDLAEASLNDLAASPEFNIVGESSTMAKEAENIDLKIVIDDDDDGACSDSSIEIVKVVKPALDSRNSDTDNNDEMTTEEGYWIVFGSNSQESVQDTDHIEKYSSDANMENNLDKQEGGLKVLNSRVQDCWDRGQEAEIPQGEVEIELSRREVGGISQGEQLKEFQVRISKKDKTKSGMFLDEKAKGTLVRLWLQTRDENVQERQKVNIKELEDCLKMMFIKTKGAVTTGMEDMQVPKTKQDINQLPQPENEVVPSKGVDESRAVSSMKESPVSVETMPTFLQDFCKDIKIAREDVGEASAASSQGTKEIVKKESSAVVSEGDKDMLDKELSAASSEGDNDMLDKGSSAAISVEQSSSNEDQDMMDKKSSVANYQGDQDMVDGELSMAGLKGDGESSTSKRDWIERELSEENVKAEDKHPEDRELCTASTEAGAKDTVDKESSATSSEAEVNDTVDKESSATSLNAEVKDTVDKESSATSSEAEVKDTVDKESSATSLKAGAKDTVDKESSATSLKAEVKDTVEKESSATSSKAGAKDTVDKESSATSSKAGAKDTVDKESSATNLKAEVKDTVDKESSATSSKAGAKDTVDNESSATSSKAEAKDVKIKETVKIENSDSEEETQNYQLLLEKEVEKQAGLSLGPDFETFLRAPHCCEREQRSLRANHDHVVLCKYRDPSKPFPREYSDCWDDKNVRMPCSPKNKHEVKDVGLVSRWDVIGDAFSAPIATSYDLQKAILSYANRKWKFKLLHIFLNEKLSPEQKDEFFKSTLPGIIRMALSVNEVVTKPPPLLKCGKHMTITMSQYQAAVLLSCAFLCMFPRRNLCYSGNEEYHYYPSINFSGLFRIENNRPISRKIEKLRCILHYFKRVVEKPPDGKISFKRQVMDHTCEKPRWDASCKRLCRLRISSDGTIEDSAPGMLQVDFANERVGGGVLGSGCVQEEIRFVICPELIVARLFTEMLQDNECLIVNGAERFSDYVGYSDSFKWAGNYEDQTPRDNWGRLCTEIVAIDALKQTGSINQYAAHYIRRELNKAYIGFHSKDINSPQNLPAVATGNWGCGAFGGDRELKSILQIMAASVANRDMIYFTFGDKEFAKTLFDLHSLLKGTDFRIKELWKMICKYKEVLNDEPTTTVFEYVYEWLKAREHYGRDSAGNKV